MNEYNNPAKKSSPAHIISGAILMIIIAGGFNFADNLFAHESEAETLATSTSNVADANVASQVLGEEEVSEKPAQKSEDEDIFKNVSNFLTASVEQVFGNESEVELKRGYIFQKENIFNSTIKANAYLVGDIDTGEILFRRNEHEKYPIASISKYITAITSLEILEQDDIATITPEALETEGNRAWFRKNDKIKIHSLLYPLLLVSSNDAAEVLAQYKNRDLFVTHMKSKVQSYGLYNTNFDDPSGLSSKNYSTATDLFKLMRAVRDNHPEIIQISKLRSLDLDGYKWTNINKAQHLEGFEGGKTGYTNAARQTSIGYYKINLANEQEKNIGIVILQSSTREKDTKNILDYLRRYGAFIE